MKRARNTRLNISQPLPFMLPINSTINHDYQRQLGIAADWFVLIETRWNVSATENHRYRAVTENGSEEFHGQRDWRTSFILEHTPAIN